MSVIAGIVVFSCIWWLVFFMTLSYGLETNNKPQPGISKSTPITFSFKQRFFKITKITCILYIILDLLIRYDCLLWILN